jgi:hypothetical protein
LSSATSTCIDRVVRVDRAGGAGDLALEALAAQLGLRHDDRLAGLDELRRRLRHVDVDPQRVGLRQQEQRAPGAGVDEVADVDVAPRDDAVERRDDALESFHLLQALHVGVGGGEVGLRLLRAAAALVELLLRDDVLLAQRLPARDRAARERQARRRLVARRDRLRELLVDLRSCRSRRAGRPASRGCRCPSTSA